VLLCVQSIPSTLISVQVAGVDHDLNRGLVEVLWGISVGGSVRKPGIGQMAPGASARAMYRSNSSDSVLKRVGGSINRGHRE
jgi:hypothetical protein